ncbi:MAG: PIN domain-containing protein [Treponema sp.]|nr:PIN domain-containing protein [Treponema sp.]
MIKVVLDANILVSSLLADGPPAVILDLVANGRLIPVYNDAIMR